jgi:hypothetical protein
MRHWTQEERGQQSALIQTWKPWNNSTGAKTPEGKAISSRNAFKGGTRPMFRGMAALLNQQKEQLKRFI